MEQVKQSPAQYITNTIISNLKDGNCAWRKTWNESAKRCNFATGKHYNGVNTLLTMLVEYKGKSSQLLTFKQAQTLGYSVPRGTKAVTPIYFFTFCYKDANGKPITAEQYDPKQGHTKYGCPRTFTMFSVSDLLDANGDHITPHGGEFQSEFNQEEILDKIKQFANIDVVIGGSAFYSPDLDKIQIPDPRNFEKEKYAMRTLFHEIGHWTGHKTRMNRDFAKTKFDNDYGYEELVAEIFSQFCVDHFGFRDTEVLHVSQGYINNWVKTLEADCNLVIKAANAAQKAFDFFLEQYNDAE